MTREELEAIRQKVKRSDEILTTVDKLREARPNIGPSNGIKCPGFDWQNEKLLHDVLRLGIDTMIERLEAELDSINVVESPAKVDVAVISATRCRGCGKALLTESAWMYDGCPCNSVLGINDGLQCPKCQLVRVNGECACRTNSAGQVVGWSAENEALEPAVTT